MAILPTRYLHCRQDVAVIIKLMNVANETHFVYLKLIVYCCAHVKNFSPMRNTPLVADGFIQIEIWVKHWQTCRYSSIYSYDPKRVLCYVWRICLCTQLMNSFSCYTNKRYTSHWLVCYFYISMLDLSSLNNKNFIENCWFDLSYNQRKLCQTYYYMNIIIL